MQWSGGDASTGLAVIAGFKSTTSLSGGRQGTRYQLACLHRGPGGRFLYGSCGSAAGDADRVIPVSGPSGGQLHWIPGGSLNEITAQKSSLSIGSIRKPGLSLVNLPANDVARLIYVLATKQDVD